MTATTVLITGASSGLGAGLARDYAATGTTLFLCGRDTTRLEAVAASCRERGARVHAEILDVTDAPAMRHWVESCDAIRPLDLVIANAGISIATLGGGEDDRHTRATFAVNLDGTLNTVLPALPFLRARRRGHVALMSSLASFRGFAGAQAYCASKAAVRLWGEGLRPTLADDGITVSVICPGFVDTPMTRINTCPMPFLLDVDTAVAIIRRGLDHGRGRIAFPWQTHLMARLAGSLPDRLMDAIARRMPRK